VLLASYLIVPSHLHAHLLVGAGFTISIALLFASGRRVADPMTMSVVWATMVLANVMGPTVSCRISTLRRRQCLAMLELQQVRDALQVMASTDPLTGVLNRRRLLEIGGEELAIVLPRTSLQTARDVAERIRTGLHDAQVVVDGSVVPVTVSLGVAALRPDDESPEDLLKRADRALYSAKRRGRDRVEAA
jgi:PleD family two-component response regulator